MLLTSLYTSPISVQFAMMIGFESGVQGRSAGGEQKACQCWHALLRTSRKPSNVNLVVSPVRIAGSWAGASDGTCTSSSRVA